MDEKIIDAADVMWDSANPIPRFLAVGQQVYELVPLTANGDPQYNLLNSQPVSLHQLLQEVLKMNTLLLQWRQGAQQLQVQVGQLNRNLDLYLSQPHVTVNPTMVEPPVAGVSTTQATQAYWPPAQQTAANGPVEPLSPSADPGDSTITP